MSSANGMHRLLPSIHSTVLSAQHLCGPRPAAGPGHQLQVSMYTPVRPQVVTAVRSASAKLRLTVAADPAEVAAAVALELYR